ncbi:hypothetical protein [Bacillus sp. 03113]|uniref:hypothetical protein n=1 Tax=Bacillus sp. 03113 TaxID=2578211 RepID=UPI0015E89DF0|nr:hypothetical protein [Bacillus sp. 03113]
MKNKTALFGDHQLTGVDFQNSTQAENLEFTQEFGLSLHEIKKLKKQMNRN